MDKKDTDLLRIDKLFNNQEKSLLTIWLKNEKLYNAEFDNEQLEKLKKKKRSKLFIPAIRNTVNIIKAIFATAFFSHGCPIELVPIGEDENELWTDRNKVIKYYFEKLKPNKELSKAFLSALLYRMGVVITYWDDSRKKVITTFIPITDIAFDSECVNIDDVQEIAYKYYESNRVIKQKIKDGYYNIKGVKKKIFKDDSSLEYSKRKTIAIVLYVNGVEIL
jgi:hypothetical protein